MVFSDDQAKTQIPRVTGSVSDGYLAALSVGVRPG
jgi:hypothetical protein